MKLTTLFGSIAVVLIGTVALAEAQPARADLTRLTSEVGGLMADSAAAFARYTAAAQKLATLYAKLDEKTTSFRKQAALCNPGCNAQQGRLLAAAAKEMEETQMSFNLQYLQLQSQMQNENRSYTAVSNIMKTKHDTVKNSISNVR